MIVVKITFFVWYNLNSLEFILLIPWLLFWSDCCKNNFLLKHLIYYNLNNNQLFYLLLFLSCLNLHSISIYSEIEAYFKIYIYRCGNTYRYFINIWSVTRSNQEWQCNKKTWYCLFHFLDLSELKILWFNISLLNIDE